MEWLDGHDLAKLLEERGLSLSEALTLGRGVAAALGAAHGRGVIHRDLKPSNLFLRGGELARVTLLDFGIARRTHNQDALTRTGVMIGTPYYMSPEQARGDRELTPAVDFFSLGCVLFECLTGRPPFAGPEDQQAAAVLGRLLFTDAPRLRELRPDLPASVEALLARLLQRDPAARLRDAEQLQAELAELAKEAEYPAPFTTAAAQTAALGREQQLATVVLATGLGLAQQETQLLLLDNTVKLPASIAALCAELSRHGAQTVVTADGSLVATVVASWGNVLDQTRQAARCAQLVKARCPDATVVLSTGYCVLPKEHSAAPTGEALSRAEQLARTEAPSRLVLVDETSAQLLNTQFHTQTTAGGTTALLEENVGLEDRRLLLGKPTPCVGRERELGFLSALWQGCREQSRSCAVLVVAPPGAGKSRLRYEFLGRVQRAGAPMLLLWGRGDPMTAGAPYGLLAQALGEHFGLRQNQPAAHAAEHLRSSLTALGPAEEMTRLALFLSELCGLNDAQSDHPELQATRKDPRALAEQIQKAWLDWLRLQCQRQPVVLIAEDLHWGDTVSVKLIEAALRRHKSRPFMTLALARPEINDTFPRLWDGQCQTLVLDPLSPAQCAELVHSALGENISPETTQLLGSQSGGNALFLEELIRAHAQGAKQAPATVIALLQARINRVPTATRRILTAASIFGEAFRLGGVSALCNASVQEVRGALETLIDDELVTDEASGRLVDEEEYRFRHALLRDAAYAMLSTAERTRAHGRAAEFLAASSQGDAAEIAEHYQQAGEGERAIAYFVRAGEAAARISEYIPARVYYRRALSELDKLADTVDNRRQCIDVLLLLGAVAVWGEPPEQTIVLLLGCKELLESLREDGLLGPADRSRLARVYYALGRCHYSQGSYVEAIQALQQASELTTQADDQALTGVILGLTGHIFNLQGRNGESITYHERSHAILHHLPGVPERALTVASLGMALVAQGHVPQGLAAISQSLEMALNQSFRGRQLQFLSLAYGMCQEWEALDATAGQAFALASHAGDLRLATLSLRLRARAAAGLGQPDLAKQYLNQARAQASGSVNLLAQDMFTAMEAEVLLAHGEVPEALATAQRAVDMARRADSLWGQGIGHRVWGRALALAAPHARAAIQHHFTESLRYLEEGEGWMEAAYTRTAWATFCLTAGDFAPAAELLEPAVVLLRAAGLDASCAHAEVLLAQARAGLSG